MKTTLAIEAKGGRTGHSATTRPTYIYVAPGTYLIKRPIQLLVLMRRKRGDSGVGKVTMSGLGLAVTVESL